jgi:hypothetical protein
MVVQDKGMKDTWCLAVSNAALTGSQIKAAYGKRFSCEEMFRDMKDMRFGLGMSWNRIGNPERRDRMFLIAALAHCLLTLLVEAGERAGLDRLLKANTRKTRTISLFRAGTALVSTHPKYAKRPTACADEELRPSARRAPGV